MDLLLNTKALCGHLYHWIYNVNKTPLTNYFDCFKFQYAEILVLYNYILLITNMRLRIKLTEKITTPLFTVTLNNTNSAITRQNICQ